MLKKRAPYDGAFSVQGGYINRHTGRGMKKIVMILLLVASAAYGEIYRWTDSKGTTHFTNSMYEIPERYRPRAKTVNLGIPEPKNDQPSTPQSPPAVATSPQAAPVAAASPQPQPSADVTKTVTPQARPVVRTNKRFKPARRPGEED